MPWKCQEGLDGETVHVFPEDEEDRHNVDYGLQCDCGPRVNRDYNLIIVSHNSEDGREYIEQAEEIKNDPDKYLPKV